MSHQMDATSSGEEPLSEEELMNLLPPQHLHRSFTICSQLGVKVFKLGK